MDRGWIYRDLASSYSVIYEFGFRERLLVISIELLFVGLPRSPCNTLVTVIVFNGRFAPKLRSVLPSVYDSLDSSTTP